MTRSSLRAREDDELESAHVQKSLRLTLEGDSRPKRSTRGQGGVVAQLEAISDQIRPDLRKGVATRSKTQAIPAEVPVNDMAPPIKQVRRRREVKSFLPVQDERPLTINVPKPSMVLAKPGSAFGFQPRTSESTTKVRTSGYRAADASTQPTEVRPDAAQNEGRQNVTGMDLDLDEFGVNPGTNIDEDSFEPIFESQQAQNSSPSGPDGHDLSEEEAAKFLKPKGLYGRKNVVLSSDDEGSDDMPAVYPKRKQRALDDATNSAFNHHDTSRTSNAAEPPVDEMSPDEEDRQALGYLKKQKPCKLHGNENLNPREMVQDNSRPVLEMHRQKNKCVKPPNPNARSGQTASFNASDLPQRYMDVSRTANVSGRTSMPQDDMSESQQRQSAVASDAPASDDGSDSNAPAMVRVCRNSRSHKDPTSSQLGFYEGHWVHILNSAKALYRLIIHTEVPFPERTDKSLKIAHECLLEATDQYMSENENVELDKGVYEAHKVGMTALIFEEGATSRGRMKTIARDVVQFYYKDQLYPTLSFNHNSAQLEEQVAHNVNELLRESLFHVGLTPDANGRTDNFSHPAVIELCKRFYYSGKHDCLSSRFKQMFRSLPEPCLAMALTCLVHCLHEFQTGSQIKLAFKGQCYDSAYNEFSEIIQETSRNAYHGQKLRKLLRRVGTEGRLKGQGSGRAHGFKVILD